jgi:hypothetical protein
LSIKEKFQKDNYGQQRSRGVTLCSADEKRKKEGERERRKETRERENFEFYSANDNFLVLI